MNIKSAINGSHLTTGGNNSFLHDCAHQQLYKIQRALP